MASPRLAKQPDGTFAGTVDGVHNALVEIEGRVAYIYSAEHAEPQKCGMTENRFNFQLGGKYWTGFHNPASAQWPESVGVQPDIYHIDDSAMAALTAKRNAHKSGAPAPAQDDEDPPF